MKYLIFFIYSLTLFAGPHHEHENENEPLVITISSGADREFCNGFDLLQHIEGMTEIHWFAAREANVKYAYCRDIDEQSPEEMQSYLDDRYSNTTPGTENFYGITLENQDPSLAYNLNLLFANYEDNQEQLLKDFPELNKCKTIKCVTEKVYGYPEGVITLYLLSKFNLNTSHHAFSDAARMPAQMLLNVNKTMQLVPIETQKLGTYNQRLTMRPSDSPNLDANALISLPASYLYRSDEATQRTILHEYYHNMDDGVFNRISRTKDWQNLSGWKYIGENINSHLAFYQDEDWEKNDELLASEYAASNPSEDFAESLISYRLTPQLLKEVNLEKYDFLKKFIFNGREFMDPNDCIERKETITSMIARDIDNFRSKINSEQISEAFNICLENTTQSRSYVDPYRFYNSCIEGQLFLKHYEELTGEEINFIPPVMISYMRTRLNQRYLDSSRSNITNDQLYMLFETENHIRSIEEDSCPLWANYYNYPDTSYIHEKINTYFINTMTELADIYCRSRKSGDSKEETLLKMHTAFPYSDI